MASAPSPPSADEPERAPARRSFALLLSGPAVLLVGSALVIGSLFLPWYHSDPRFLVGDPYPSDFQPFVPMQSYNFIDQYWPVLVAFPIMAALVCLLIDTTPRWRDQAIIRASAIIFGIFALMAAGVGIILLILYPVFLSMGEGVPRIWDSGYVIALVGYILLAPGAILVMIGQRQVRRMVRLGRLRAP